VLYGREVQRPGKRSNDRSKAGRTLKGTYGVVILALALILGGCGDNEAQDEQQDVQEEQQDVQEDLWQYGRFSVGYLDVG
jgi:hypothetical protein